MLFLLPDELHQDPHFRPTPFLEIFEPHQRDVAGDLSSKLFITIEISQLPLIQIIWINARLTTSPVRIVRQFLCRYTDS